MSATVAVERSIWIAAPREKVWQSVTDPAQLQQWYAVGCPWEIPMLQVGALVKFHNTPEDILTATIIALDVPQKFALEWLACGDASDAKMVTSFLLEEASGGTTVTIMETGFDVMGETEDFNADTIARGYTESLENLKSLLESGS